MPGSGPRSSERCSVSVVHGNWKQWSRYIQTNIGPVTVCVRGHGHGGPEYREFHSLAYAVYRDTT